MKSFRANINVSQKEIALYFSNKELLDSEPFRYLFVCLSAMPPAQLTPAFKKITKDIE
ncbi:hypothetical protein [Planococcus sp. YIM B11945]|uniref:hypothetical protein n=1 Tax=Planococcus sp. YIM B11945 TaxID=3435410 RepID=UPI003D7E6483